MKRLFLLTVLFIISISAFAERMYYKKHGYGTIKLEKEKDEYILRTEEIDSDGFLVICVVNIHSEDMANEFVFVIERQKLNGKYAEFFNELSESETNFSITKERTFFDNDNLVFEYTFDVEE